MFVGEFNANISKTLTEAFETGQPQPIERKTADADFVTVVSTSVLNELIQAAGDHAPKTLEHYRAEAVHQKQENAA